MYFSRCLLQVPWEDIDQTASVLISVMLEQVFETSESFQTTQKCQNSCSIFIRTANTLVKVRTCSQAITCQDERPQLSLLLGRKK